ncbi:hypothetical protein [Nitrosomonas mobilis]|uniref:Transposase n=1 Tax=Nitrosomonas mobilis TaxID=51642 RepID=A0A1G5SI99_9PROT|nr:hypothetical protein NSMM_690008 [Nitrosomonas mobilis]
MKKHTAVELTGPDRRSDSLTELLRTEAKQLLEQAVEAELAGFMEQFSGKRREIFRKKPTTMWSMANLRSTG